MHELGVVFHVVEQVEELAKSNNVKHVNAVVLEIGTVSGIVNSYLTDCWNWAVSKHEILKNCELKIEKVHAVSHCNQCNEDFNTILYGKECPKCKSTDTYLVKGNEFLIKEIEVI